MLRLVFESGGSLVLFWAAFLAFSAWRQQSSRFRRLACIGVAYLALDDLLDLHVGAARLLEDDFGLHSLPGINHLDDVLVIFTGIAGLLFVTAFRNDILADRGFSRLLGISMAAFAAAIVVDARLNPSSALAWWTEETLEFAGSAAMALAFRGLRVTRRAPQALRRVGVGARMETSLAPPATD